MKTLPPNVREALNLLMNMFGNDFTHFLWAKTASCRPLHRGKNKDNLKKHTLLIPNQPNLINICFVEMIGT